MNIRSITYMLPAVLLAGCVQGRSASQYHAVGTVNSQAVDLMVQGVEASTGGIDPTAALQGTVAALRGDVAGLAASVAAQPPALSSADVEAAARRAAPAPLTGAALSDSLLAALAAYLAGKGGLAAARKLKTPKG